MVGDRSFFVHPTAIIDEPCEIGAGTKIWHFCHVMAGARIGANCVLGQNVLVASDVVVGNGCKIQNNVSLYTGVELEDFVFCGPSCVFTNVVNPRAEINRRAEFLRTLVRRGATIGANATIVCGATIGRYAFIGAGAVVRGDVPDYALMLGVPARRRGWMSRHDFACLILTLTVSWCVRGAAGGIVWLRRRWCSVRIGGRRRSLGVEG
jgi:UDP-2-acetamido-3-amino-2,3-dideoxy-glucuronate N-acetyltransferase